MWSNIKESTSIIALNSQFTVLNPNHKINFWMIRAFEGPRHSRLEAIWDKFARQHKKQINLNIFDNKGAVRRHDECLEEIWQLEQKLPEARCIITEFDFLPEHSAAQWPFDTFSLVEPIQAAEYCTRDPVSRKVDWHSIPGAWFIRISKPLLRSAAKICFRAGGPFNDPANCLSERLTRTAGQRVRLLRSEDCYPGHFGVRVLGAGQHLFWARHYNDNPLGTAAGFKLSAIFAGVDQAIQDYERTH